MKNVCGRIIKYGLYLLVFLLPLWVLPFSFEIFEFNKLYLLFFLVSLIFFVWIFKMIVLDKEIRFCKTPFDIPVLVFLLSAILSAIFSVDKVSSIFGFYGRFSDSLIVILSLGALYFLITNNVSLKPLMTTDKKRMTADKKSAKISHKSAEIGGMLKAFLWSAALVVLISYLSIFNIFGKVFGKGGLFLQRTFNPVSGSLEGLAIFLVGVVALLVSFMFFEPERKGKSKTRRIKIGEVKKGRIRQIAQIKIEQIEQIGEIGYHVLLFLSLFLLLIIDFWPTWIILFLISGLLGIAFWLGIFPRQRKRTFLWLMVSLMIFSLSGISSNAIRDTFNLVREVVLPNKISWQVSLKALKARPILGTGPGTFFYNFAKFKPVEFNQTQLWQIRFDRPSNHIAEVLATRGALGFLSYLVLIGFVLGISWSFGLKPLMTADKKLRTADKKSAKISHKSVVISGIPLLMPFLTLFIAQFFYYQNISLAFSFWLIMALCAVNLPPTTFHEKWWGVSFLDFPELSTILLGLVIVFGVVFSGTFFFAGKFYLADMNYAKAQRKIGSEKINLMEKAVELNPYCSQYKTLLARLYLNEAISEMAKPEANEVLFSFYIHQAITYCKGGIQLALLPEDGTPIAKSYIKGATEIALNQVTAWETLGMIYRDVQPVAEGALDWGIKAFEKAIELEPTNPILYTELGKLYLNKNEVSKAKEKFNKAKTLKPDYVDALIQAILIYEKEDNLQEAISQMQELSEKLPFNSEVSFQLGRLYFNGDEIEKAISQFKKVLEGFPNHSNALYSLAMAYSKKGEKELAIEAFEKVLELNPGNLDVKLKLEELKK